MLLKEIFGENRIIGLAGDKSTGKTNNLMFLLKDFRKINVDTPIYVYGLDEITLKWVMKLGKVFEISTLEHLTDKENSLIILDEVQKLRLNNRRHIQLRNDFVDFIYHKNNWAIVSSPSLREFNTVLGAIIERWLLKSMRLTSLINGSQLKSTVLDYNGRYKCINNIEISKNKILVINKDFERVVECSYIKEIDKKPEYRDIFESPKKK